jgi:hypothetical protein
VKFEKETRKEKGERGGGMGDLLSTINIFRITSQYLDYPLCFDFDSSNLCG